MHALLVLTIAIGVVSADIGLGYHYKVPQTSYGVPSYQVSSNAGGNYNTGYAGNSGSSGYNYKGQSGYQGLSAGQQNAGYQGLSAGQQNAGYQGLTTGQQNTGYQTTGQQNTGYQGLTTGQQSSGYPSLAAGQQNGYQGAFTGLQSGSGYQTSGTGASSQYYTSPSSGSSNVVANTLLQPNYQTQSGGNVGQSAYQYQTANQYQEKYQHQYQIQQQPAQVFKHFYVHAAPEEPETVRPRNPVVLPAPQKHYKIIFIKTPSQSGVGPQYVPVQAQNEEKTIVYVLVKKPEDYQDVVVPKVEQKPPSKPEVYFIKYNSKEDSQAVINNIVGDYNNKGQSASFAGAGASSTGGSYSGQSALSSGSSSSSGLTTGVSSTGLYSGQSNVGSGQVAVTPSESQLLSTFGSSSYGQANKNENQASTSFGSAFGSGSSGAVSLASVETNGSTAGAYDSNASSAFSSSTANYDSANAISTSQGVPHESYGIPKFKVE